ncbi:cache domain-containing sensor histidine kinase [Konateibacter massiliensis]|uniref:cache domain-containing sensor histidine kinase n=1 Tax=Konateibacter massiliensis TaxID=2002841 RepID=UPI000C15CF4F|nr:sensor histidine kinase [Konateibacter massiliensis]
MLQRLKKQIYNVSLKYKIAFISLVVALIPLLLFAIIMTQMYNKAITERSRQNMEENSSVMSDRIEKVFSNAETCSNYLALNINSVMDEELIEVTRDGRILGELNSAGIIFTEMESIVYMNVNGSVYTTDPYMTVTAQEIQASPYYEQVKETTGKTILFSIEKGFLYDELENSDVITFGKKIIEKESGETLGYLFINIMSDEIEKYFDNKVSYYYLADANDYLVHTKEMEADDKKLYNLILSEKLLDNSNSQTFKMQGNNYLYTSLKCDEYEMRVIGITNLDEFNVEFLDIVYTFLWIGSIIAILLVVFIFFLTEFITRPLVILKKGAEEIANGNMQVRFEFKTGDEIGKLGTIFNYMTGEIVALLQRVDEEAKKKREYELALIQEQVKPHFLYNTLEIIIMLLQMNKNKTAQRVTKKLADYYKNSLSNSEEIVPLEKEIRIVQDYLELQLMRYEDKFTYDISVGKGTGTVEIPKMTLQPLIENAIYHGLKYKEEWGNISIISQNLGTVVEIIVKDNGIGMKEETLQKMLELKDKPQGHFGVYSVDHRLKLFYGEGFGIEVTSEYQVGTQIKVTIPSGDMYDKNNDC